MKTLISKIALCLMLLLSIQAHAQLVNCNPDPNGEPWWAGGLPEVTPEIQAELEAIPPLVISTRSSTTTLPSQVDNSQKIWFRPVFLQDSACCGQASGVGYTFTYEINRMREDTANLPENQYPTHFTWNFLNKQDRDGSSWYYQGWDIIKQMGVPSVQDYGGMSKICLQSSTDRANVWETGYEKYKETLNNKVITEYHYIDVSTPAGLETLKHWLNDHGLGDDSGGLANFAAKIYNAEYRTLTNESIEAGKKIVYSWGNDGLHAMTIVGYDDNVKYDFNGDGQFTNSNPNDMTTWEVGALKIANSWGTSYCDSGFVYMPYRLLSLPYHSGGIYMYNNKKQVHVLTVSNTYNPEMTMKVKIKHTCRKKLKLYADIAENANQPAQLGTNRYKAFNDPKAWYGAGCLPMQGINEDPIELCLDYGQFYNLNNVGKVCFSVYQSSGQHNGIVSDFSLIDYRWNEVFELPYHGEAQVSIVSNGYTSLGIPYHLLPFDRPIDNNIVNGLDEANTRHYEYGFLFHNCGEGGLGSLLLRNTIKGCTETGVTLYASTANALKKLLIAENLSEENYGELQQFYRNETAIQDNEILAALAGTFANKCDELQEHYDEAIAWYETIIEDEETPYNDSLFATIDLGNLYLKMEAGGIKGIKGTLTQFIPKSAEAFAKQTDEALKKLKSVPRRSNPSRELPDQYWTDLVTEQPEGYEVDANGNVHLHSAEALAWLCSVTNGLNGQEADDFNGKKVTLEANVDMSEAIWIPIADGTNLGDPNPDRMKFCGTFDGNGFVVNGLILSNNPFYYGNFESFFGNLCGARIENVVLRHVYSEGRNERDGKFFGNAELFEKGTETRQTVINRCYMEIDEMRKSGQNRESSLFGYKNEGVITNCMVRCGKLSYPGNSGESEDLFVYDNRGTIQNCASVADSLKWLHQFGGIANENHGIIENCYSYIGTWFGDYQIWWPPTPRLGVCVNNFGTIRNCYYNKFDPCDFSNTPAYTNQGSIANTECFFKTDDWVLDNPVEVQGENGVVYETTNLLEALNYWILGHGNEDVYMSWCEDNSFLKDNLPVLCNLDITVVSENNNANDVISVFPNPTMGVVRIEGEKATEIQVFNALGQLVKTVQNTNEVSLEGQPQGLYLLRVTLENGKVFSDKVVKE